MIVINSLTEATYPHQMEEGTKKEPCQDCVRRKKQHCKEELNYSCREKIIVYRLLSPTEQKIYWFLKSASKSGERGVKIRNNDFTASIGSAHRSFHYAFHSLKDRGFIEVETLSIKGMEKTSPRKLYRFIGVPKDAMERFNFSH